MNMDKVESVQIDQSIFGRMLDYGNVTILGTGEGASRRSAPSPAQSSFETVSPETTHKPRGPSRHADIAADIGFFSVGVCRRWQRPRPGGPIGAAGPAVICPWNDGHRRLGLGRGVAFDVNQNWDLRRHLILFVLPSFAARQPRFEKVQADNAASKKRRKPSGSKTTAKAKQIADGRTTVEKTRATKAKGKVKAKTAVNIVEGSGAPSYPIALSRGGVSSLAVAESDSSLRRWRRKPEAGTPARGKSASRSAPGCATD